MNHQSDVVAVAVMDLISLWVTSLIVSKHLLINTMMVAEDHTLVPRDTHHLKGTIHMQLKNLLNMRSTEALP